MAEYTPTDNELRAMANSYDGVPNDVFDRWLEAHDRQVKADAWDEGRKFGELPKAEKRYCICRDESHHERNPYRSELP